MCKVMEDMRNETAWQNTVEIVHRALDMDLPHEQIAQFTGLTVDQVKEIAGQKAPAIEQNGTKDDVTVHIIRDGKRKEVPFSGVREGDYTIYGTASSNAHIDKSDGTASLWRVLIRSQKTGDVLSYSPDDFMSDGQKALLALEKVELQQQEIQSQIDLLRQALSKWA